MGWQRLPRVRTKRSRRRRARPCCPRWRWSPAQRTDQRTKRRGAPSGCAHRWSARLPRCRLARRQQRRGTTPVRRQSEEPSSSFVCARRDKAWLPPPGLRAIARLQHLPGLLARGLAELLVVLLEHLLVLRGQSLLHGSFDLLAVAILHVAPAVGQRGALLQLADAAIAVG